MRRWEDETRQKYQHDQHWHWHSKQHDKEVMYFTPEAFNLYLAIRHNNLSSWWAPCLALLVCLKQGSDNMVLVVQLEIGAKDLIVSLLHQRTDKYFYFGCSKIFLTYIFPVLSCFFLLTGLFWQDKVLLVFSCFFFMSTGKGEKIGHICQSSRNWNIILI